MAIRIPEDVVATAESKRVARQRAAQAEREARRRFEEEERERFAKLKPDIAFVLAWAKELTATLTLPHRVRITHRRRERFSTAILIEPDGRVCRFFAGGSGGMGGSSSEGGHEVRAFAKVKDCEGDFRAARQAIESGEVWDRIRESLAEPER